MQEKSFFKYLNWLFKVILIFCFVVAVLQNYFSENGTVSFFGYKLTQFYPHIEVRILPLLFVSYLLIPIIRKNLNLSQKFYLSETLITAQLAFDAFTHTNGFYSKSIGIMFFDEMMWFDKGMHFLEGFILIVAIYPLVIRFASSIKQFNNPKVWAYLIITGFSSIFYILWEIVEVIIDKSIGKELLVTGRYDTNEDLMMAYIGTFFGIIVLEFFYFFKSRLNKKV